MLRAGAKAENDHLKRVALPTTCFTECLMNFPEDVVISQLRFYCAHGGEIGKHIFQGAADSFEVVACLNAA